MDDLNEFIDWLKRQIERKTTLYDGYNNTLGIDFLVVATTEELGEVATAVNRERWLQAEAECIDLANCAFLIFRKIKQLRQES